MILPMLAAENSLEIRAAVTWMNDENESWTTLVPHAFARPIESVRVSKVAYISRALGRAMFPLKSETISTRQDFLEFNSLRDAWRRERSALSSATQMAMTPSYQRIIGMGERAIPQILRGLEAEGDNPDHWFWALAAITRANPVPEEHRGDMPAMARAWIEWARDRYAW